MHGFGFYLSAFLSLQIVGDKADVLVNQLQVLHDQNYHNMPQKFWSLFGTKFWTVIFIVTEFSKFEVIFILTQCIMEL